MPFYPDLPQPSEPLDMTNALLRGQQMRRNDQMMNITAAEEGRNALAHQWAVEDRPQNALLLGQKVQAGEQQAKIDITRRMQEGINRMGQLIAGAKTPEEQAIAQRQWESEYPDVDNYFAQAPPEEQARMGEMVKEWARQGGAIKPPAVAATREVPQLDGSVAMQEQQPDGTWKEIGRGRKRAETEQEFFERDPDGFARMKAAKAQGGGGADPYFTPVQSSGGLYTFDNRTGKFVPATDAEGKPILPVAADPDLARDKKEATERGKAEVAKEVMYPKVRESYRSLTRQWDLVDSKLDEAIASVSPWTTGVGAWAKVIPATPQKDLSETLETIKANIGFDKLQDMRQNSPTGGALGQVSDFENKLLQAVQGSLDQKQSPARLKQNLARIKEMLAQLRAQKDQAFSKDFGEFQQRDQGAGGQTPPTGGIKFLGFE